VSKIEQNGKTSLRRPKLLIKEVKHLMKKYGSRGTEPESVSQWEILATSELTEQPL